MVKTFPIHVHLEAGEGGFSKASMILCDQIRTVEKGRLMYVMGHLSTSTMAKVDAAVKISLALK